MWEASNYATLPTGQPKNRTHSYSLHMKHTHQTPSSPTLIKNHLPENDFLGTGVCSKPRPVGVPVDTVIIHSCYVDEKICSAPALAPCSESLAAQWLAAKTQAATGTISSEELPQIEVQILRELVVSDAGKKELSTYSVNAIKAIFRFYGVSAHYVLDREGIIHELVPPDKLAFHAGKSKMPAPDDGRESVNNFSIGIELLGTETSGFTEAQYQSLQWLIGNLKQTYPIKNLLGHSQIAPGRKTDPHHFDWSRITL